MASRPQICSFRFCARIFENLIDKITSQLSFFLFFFPFSIIQSTQKGSFPNFQVAHQKLNFARGQGQSEGVFVYSWDPPHTA